jgi:hypothetical protein
MPNEIIWWQHQNRVQALARFLLAIGELYSTDSLMRFFEKPWKWENEWKSYLDMVRVRDEEFPRKDLCDLTDIYYKNMEHLEESNIPLYLR